MTEPTLAELKKAAYTPRWYLTKKDSLQNRDRVFVDVEIPTLRYVREVTPYQSEQLKLIKKIICVNETESLPHQGYICLYDGYKFQTVLVDIDFNTNFRWPDSRGSVVRSLNGIEMKVHESPSLVIYPLDERMTRKDIEGSTNILKNSTNTGWIFQHCDSDYHKDYEYHLTSALNSVFAREKDLAHDIAHSKTYAVFLNNTPETRHVMGAATRLVDNLRDLHADIELEILKEHKEKYIGWYHQNPNDSHIHELLARAFRKVMKAWEADNDILAKWLSVKEPAKRMLNRITIHYPYKHRWVLSD